MKFNDKLGTEIENLGGVLVELLSENWDKVYLLGRVEDLEDSVSYTANYYVKIDGKLERKHERVNENSLGKGILALATASKTAFQAGKVAVDFAAGLGTVIWTMDKARDKIAGAMQYIGADPSLTGDVIDFLDSLVCVFQNYADGNAYLSLGGSV